MEEKVVKNRLLISIFLSIVSIGLIISELLDIIDNGINNDSSVILIYRSMIIGSACVLIVLGFIKKDINKKNMILPIILLYGASAFINSYYFYKYDGLNYIYYIVLYSAAIILYLLYIFKDNIKIRYALLIVISIILCFNILGVFSGTSMSLAQLLLSIVFILNVYSLKEEKQNEES